MNKDIVINNFLLDVIDLSDLMPYITGFGKLFFAKRSGVEPYRLLRFFSSIVNNTIIIDLGTSNGASAIALSHNKTNHVYSFDVLDRTQISYSQNNNIFENVPYFSNIDFIVTENFLKYKDLILKSKLIYLDIDHSGHTEKQLINFLIKEKYKGYAILDDIYEFPGLTAIWQTEYPNCKKIDLTKYGHWSGTGLLDFSKHTIFKLT
jgi:hypothetical protein